MTYAPENAVTNIEPLKLNHLDPSRDHEQQISKELLCVRSWWESKIFKAIILCELWNLALLLLVVDEVPSKFRVGGGTRFSPVFNWIDRQDMEPDGVIMFTDMGSSDYGDMPAYPVLWASSVPVYDYDRAPFGDIVEIELT